MGGGPWKGGVAGQVQGGSEAQGSILRQTFRSTSLESRVVGKSGVS